MVPEIHSIKNYFASVTPMAAFFWILPFLTLLACLAILPLFAQHFWEKNRNKALVSLLLGAPSLIFFLFRDWHVLFHTFLDYAAFLSLLGSLFVISGGIYIRGAFAGLPWVNTLFLFLGALLSNFIGTTGASMLLIRPLLRANKTRRHKVHIIIFFIFIVSNCSGLLTPLGDPPLFLGFLKGISFGWTLQLLPEWFFVVTTLLVAFFATDHFWFNKEHVDTRKILIQNHGYLSDRFGVLGKRNFLFLAMVVCTILISGYFVYPMPGSSLLGEPFGAVMSKVLQVFGMLILAVLSFRLTESEVHEKNHFSFSPIVEVAVLFAGIFLAMVPALMILETQGANLHVSQPWQFYWMSGLLSSFLDNAPTYLTFTSLAKGTLQLTGEGLSELMSHPQGIMALKAISCGSVMMGANSYIGNGPNFMVKAIAEHSDVKMPSFFGYMLWSVLILIPLFLLVTLLFF